MTTDVEIAAGRSHHRRTAAAQMASFEAPFGACIRGSLGGSHVLIFGSQTLILGAFAAYGGCHDRWTHFRRVVRPFMLSDLRATVNLRVVRQMRPGHGAGPEVSASQCFGYFDVGTGRSIIYDQHSHLTSS